MNHFTDLYADLFFVNIPVSIHKYNEKSSESDFHADLIADLISAGTG
jgi:hypothetical protein